jgi:hypothetical protein
MSDQENENSKDEKDSNKARPAKKAPPNPFLSSLRDNQVAQAKEALMKTVCDNPENTLGSIIEALENDTDGEYIMFEIFKGLTVEELVRAAAPGVLPGWGKVEMASISLPYTSEDEDDEDLDDDDEFEDDGSLEDEDDSSDATPSPTKSRKSTKKKPASKKKVKSTTGKKKASPKAESKPKAESGTEDLAYQKAILQCLSENKARTPETAMSGKDIREIAGGDDVEFRAAMGSIRDKGRAGSTGQARGTKYFRIAKKKDA